MIWYFVDHDGDDNQDSPRYDILLCSRDDDVVDCDDDDDDDDNNQGSARYDILLCSLQHSHKVVRSWLRCYVHSCNENHQWFCTLALEL